MEHYLGNFVFYSLWARFQLPESGDPFVLVTAHGPNHIDDNKYLKG